MICTEEEISTKQILEEIINNRKELKNAVEASEARLLLEFEELNYKIRSLERENKQLKSEIEEISKSNKKNGIVIYGLHLGKEQKVEEICEKIKTLLEVDISPNHINAYHILGKKENSPVKIELVQFWKKTEILKNSFKLKGQNIYIVPDLTKKQLEDRKVLQEHLKLAKKDKVINCYIKGNKLYANGQIYTVDDLKQEDIVKPITKVNSAPQTPIITNNQSEEGNLGKKTPTTRKTKLQATLQLHRNLTKILKQAKKEYLNHTPGYRKIESEKTHQIVNSEKKRTNISNINNPYF